ncbi:hypothetical protein [Paraconexibacter sp.]|uniref:hypothetical protein n=1 Tax=Paraconexibacter sp. TaxID=2949640 RepID=UPI0035687EA7
MTRAATRALLLVVGLLAGLACGGTSSQATSTGLSSSDTPATAAVTASGRLPADFLGLVSEHAFAAGPADRAKILGDQRRTGVQLLRQTFDWSTIEKTRGVYDFSIYDGFVHATARARIRLLPIIFRAPAFRSRTAKPSRTRKITATTTFPPRSNADMARFAARLVRRYGPRGTFWKENPDLPPLPIRSWQVWNEPNLPAYWGGRPNAKQYVSMLRTVGSAIRKADRKAEIVSGGIPESRQGIPLRTYLTQMRRAGGLKTFTTLAIHPYARNDAGVITAVSSTRRLLNGWGYRRMPIWVTELGWASQGPRSAFTAGPTRQGRYILHAITGLGQRAKQLNVRGVVYYGWKDAEPYPGGKDFWGLHTGLLRQDGTGKPALSKYYQAAGVLKRVRFR